MEINFDKFKVRRVKDELDALYTLKECVCDEVSRLGSINDCTNTALRVIQLDAKIEEARRILRFLGINAYYDNDEVVLVDYKTDEEITV